MMKFLRSKKNKSHFSDDTMIAVNLWEHKHPRLVTVINNYPWYKSSGKSSGHPGTWFFFGGVLEEKIPRHARGWLIKPTSLSKERYSRARFFGANVDKYMHEHSIRSLISSARFGDIEKICISASLDGGFWLSDEGKQLKNYLQENYPDYFLSNESIDKVHTSAKRSDLTVYTDPKKVNSWLMRQGVSTVGVLHDESLLITP